MKYYAYFGVIYIYVDEVSWISKKLLQSVMDSYYKLRQLFYYKVRHGSLQIATRITKCNGLLQIATGITKSDNYYKLRQYSFSTIFLPYGCNKFRGT